MMASVRAHENERVRLRPHARQRTEMTDGVARGVKEVEGAVPEVIDSPESANSET